MIRNLFLTTLESSLITSIIVLVLLLLAPLLNKRYAAKWKYWLWIFLAFRLVIPFYWNTPYQQFIIPVPPQATVPVAPDAGAGIPVVLQTGNKQTAITLLDFAAAIWVIGFLVSISVNLLSYLHYKKQVMKNGIPVKNSYILDQLSSLAKDLQTSHKITILEYQEAESPMIIGFLKPVLVLPENEYDNEELFFILKHELIHLKRHDVYFKLLFSAATALHWFNPVIYIMLKEAGIDMELSCDERVIQGMAYDAKKAYTETLFSSLYKQYKKKSILSAKFYGGTNIMKKRFKNILIKTRKKNGLPLLVCVVSVTLVLGTITGCSITEPVSNVSLPASKKTGNSPLSVIRDTQPENIQRPDGIKTEEETLTADGKEIKDIVEAFAVAYFSGDKEDIQNYLTTPYKWDIDVYEGDAGMVSNMSVKGLTGTGRSNTGDTCTISVEYKSSAESDTFLYLTIGLVKKPKGWKIQFYGTEM